VDRPAARAAPAAWSQRASGAERVSWSKRASWSQRPAWSARAQALMVAHVVLFKTRPGFDAAARQRLAGAFQHALRDIPSIRRAHIGRRVRNGRPYEQLMTVDYEYAAVLEFDTVADLTAYLTHSAHEELGARFFEAFEVALMYDYEMQEGEAGLAALVGQV
jgi:hypothetical protein